MNDTENKEERTFEQRVMEQFSLFNGGLSKLEVATDPFGLGMSKLERTVEDYFPETRLAWEQVLKEIMDVKDEVRTTNRQLQVLSTRDLMQAADILDLRGRLDRLETDPNSPTNRLP